MKKLYFLIGNLVLISLGFGCANRTTNIKCEISKNGNLAGDINFKLKSNETYAKVFISFKGSNTETIAYATEDNKKYDIEVNYDFLENSRDRWISFRLKKNNLINPRVLYVWDDGQDNSSSSAIFTPYDYACFKN